ncbi:hypothetical protein BCUE_0010 [Candidatus Kinetoplastibacterium blastocrithidii TCC012E]|uniref:Uncharacterized protein n=1 Tax=Candidatus Kinetoplastidibacterium blastocrithidiae TCC012E TaxID=1208922 RepID=M1LWW3_9PROT|nr:hypothetical protein BCUE_0010 [Candidatus Kinetoplastibacterium blastocrithidii TCC012E]
MIYSTHKEFSSAQMVCCITANLVSYPMYIWQKQSDKNH